MVCPFCNNEMTKGKILGDRYKLKWIPDDEKLILGIWADNPTIIKNQTRGKVGGRVLAEAFKCAKCRKLITDIL